VEPRHTRDQHSWVQTQSGPVTGDESHAAKYAFIKTWLESQAVDW
jgi:hypothetical protein